MSPIRHFLPCLNLATILLFASVLGSPGVAAAQRAQRPSLADLQAQIDALNARVAELENKLRFVTVEEGAINGLAGPNWILEGANLHVRSGSGETSDGCSFEDPECGSLTALGNIVVGYNETCEEPLPFPRFCGQRTGSHNLVVGPQNSYSSYGGLVAGIRNQIRGAHASVSGGGQQRGPGAFLLDHRGR